jgi:exopolysaccharide biosynthesis polyprenyl glycosylphosphotransferase
LKRQALIKFFELSDLALVACSFLIVDLLQYRQQQVLSITDYFSARIQVRSFALFLVLLLAWHIVFTSFGLYRSRRLSQIRSEILDVLKATTFGSVLLLIPLWLLAIGQFSPLFLVAFWLTISLTTVVSRVTLRHFLKEIRLRGRNLRHLLVVGTNRQARDFVRRVERKPALGYIIVGFVDEGTQEGETPASMQDRVVCDAHGLADFIRSQVVDEVMIALPLEKHYGLCSLIVRLCEEQGIIVRFLSGFFDLMRGQLSVEPFEGRPVVTIHGQAVDDWHVLVKLVFDRVIALLLIALSLPLAAVIAIAIRATSPGPVFFVQERLGFNKRRFRLYKFRTMLPDAEKRLAEIEHLNEASGPVFKIRDDPRVTPIGRFLRKTSLDELPQLFNVLRGEMSLVGPRPLPVRDYEGFSRDWQRRRFSVRPGMTCLWQVQGRSSIPFDEWMELDMYYIDHWSLWLDFKILAKTVTAVLKGSGAH